MKNKMGKDDKVEELNKIIEEKVKDQKEDDATSKYNFDDSDQNEIKKALIRGDRPTLYGFALVVLMIIVILFFTSCSKNVEFLPSSVVPAAQGYINVTTDNNNNYVIEIQVSDLADIERLQPAKKSYVVWAETDEGNTENIGQLSSSTSFFSSQREASLKTVSSYKPTKIFITAENSINIQDPSSFVVLSTKEFN